MIVMAGGTGGHVYPALAVAEYLRAHGVHVVWLGTRSGLESRAVPAAGFEIEWLTIKGLRGQGIRRWIIAPWLLTTAALQTVVVFLRRRPGAVLGMGGFVAGPGGLIAWLLRLPLLIHEANAVAGWTNRWLVRAAYRVMTGFPETFGSRKRVMYVGNPVRADIAAVAQPVERMAHRSGSFRVLVIGGSQGALKFNELVPRAVAAMPAAERPEIWHQCGQGNAPATEEAYRESGAKVKAEEFVEDMAAAYAWADVVLSRAGAMTVAELAVVGVAAVLVPYPYAVNDHQTANASYLADRGAATLIPESELTVERLCNTLAALQRDRAGTIDMAVRSRELGKPDATVNAARICLEALGA